jgi:hypothetical protein
MDLASYPILYISHNFNHTLVEEVRGRVSFF